MDSKKVRMYGYIILAIGSLIIFLSAMLNTVNFASDSRTETFRSLYVFDVFSTLGVILIPWGLSVIMGKKSHVTKIKYVGKMEFEE